MQEKNIFFRKLELNIPASYDKENFIKINKTLKKLSNKTYSLNVNPGYLRLYPKPNTIENRKNFSLIGFRQKESDFDYEVKMNYKPSDESVFTIFVDFLLAEP